MIKLVKCDKHMIYHLCVLFMSAVCMYFTKLMGFVHGIKTVNDQIIITIKQYIYIYGALLICNNNVPSKSIIQMCSNTFKRKNIFQRYCVEIICPDEHDIHKASLCAWKIEKLMAASGGFSSIRERFPFTYQTGGSQ